MEFESNHFMLHARGCTLPPFVNFMSSCSHLLPSAGPISQQLHSDIMPRLPLECVAKVIEWIDHPHDLFSLLTVSKDVFLIAARRLYHDPIRNHIYPLDDNTRRLILFLLSQSPATGKDIETIRQSNGLPPYGAPLDPHPMLDYLSLVKVIHWRGRLRDEGRLCSALRYPNGDICRQLTWSFVGHRLDEVEELEIDVDDRERYLNNVAKMTRLRKLWIHVGDNRNYKDMYDFAEAIVKAFQLHHGPNQLHECHMIPNPFLKGPTSVDEYGDIQYEFHDIDLSCTQRVLSLLPQPKQYPILPSPDGSAVSLNHSFDPCVATIQSIWCTSHSIHNLNWKAIMKVYAGQSLAQILQRFRGLTSLSINIGTFDVSDEDLLAWAAYEAEHHFHQSRGHQLVPLERLEIKYDISDCDLRRKLKIFYDGLLGFSRTLKWLKVIYLPSHDGMVDRLLTIPQPLHSLKSLTLENLIVDRSSWDQAPNIEELELDFHFPWPVVRQSEYDEEQGGHPSLTTSIATDQEPQRPLPELWFHCPKLKGLTLRDQAINLLDPNCFHHLPSLQQLSLLSSIVTFRTNMDQCGVSSCDTWEALKPVHPARWTWDWSFPLLRYLTLYGDLYEFKFSWALLYAYPTLECIDFRHDDGNRHYPLHVKRVLDASLDTNNQMLPFTHSNITSITLNGMWAMEVDELACLLQVLPCLKRLMLGWVKGIGDRELIEITKTHPSLIQVESKIMLTTKPPSALGLSKIDYETMESIEGAIEDDYDAKTSKERACIIYKFYSYKCYALWLWSPHEYDCLSLLVDETRDF